MNDYLTVIPLGLISFVIGIIIGRAGRKSLIEDHETLLEREQIKKRDALRQADNLGTELAVTKETLKRVRDINVELVERRTTLIKEVEKLRVEMDRTVKRYESLSRVDKAAIHELAQKVMELEQKVEELEPGADLYGELCSHFPIVGPDLNRHLIEHATQIMLLNSDEVINGPPTESVLEQLKSVHHVQGSHGNWDFDPYSHGMFNGMEVLMALVEDREPEFKDAPNEWLADHTKTKAVAVKDLKKELKGQSISTIVAAVSSAEIITAKSGPARLVSDAWTITEMHTTLHEMRLWTGTRAKLSRELEDMAEKHLIKMVTKGKLTRGNPKKYST